MSVPIPTSKYAPNCNHRTRNQCFKIQWSDFNEYDVASGSEVSNVMAEKKAERT